MNKGIFYVVCSAVILLALLAGFLFTEKTIVQTCTGKQVNVVVSATPTPSLVVSGTATPTAAFKTLQKAVK